MAFENFDSVFNKNKKTNQPTNIQTQPANTTSQPKFSSFDSIFSKSTQAPATVAETKTPKQIQVENTLDYNKFLDSNNKKPVEIPTQFQIKENPFDKLPQTKLEQAPVDTRPEDTFYSRVGRYVLPEFLQKELGISETQVQPAKQTTAQFLEDTGTQQTLYKMQQSPEQIDAKEYFRRGLTFGNDLNVLHTFDDLTKGYKSNITVEDLPDAVTTKQKTLEAIGNVTSMALAQPLIEEAAASLVTKIPGGAGWLETMASKAITNPWTTGFGYQLLKSAGTGGLFGLITNNRKSVAENVLETAGTFAGFTALAYPIQMFFRPIISQVGKLEMENANMSKTLNDPSVTQEPISKTLWFKNPEDDSQLLKVTVNGVKFVPKNSTEVANAGLDINNLAPVTKVEIEAFKSNPSLYDNLVAWLKDGKPKAKEVPFTVADNVAKDPYAGQTPKDDPSNVTSAILRDKVQTASPAEKPNLQAKLSQFEKVASNPTVTVNDDSGNRIASINTVEYSDGKYAVNVNANTENSGMVTNFSDSDLFYSEQEAIEAGKTELQNWVNDEVSKSESDIEQKQMETILEKLKNMKDQIVAGREINQMGIEAQLEYLTRNVSKQDLQTVRNYLNKGGSLTADTPKAKEVMRILEDIDNKAYPEDVAQKIMDYYDSKNNVKKRDAQSLRDINQSIKEQKQIEKESKQPPFKPAEFLGDKHVIVKKGEYIVDRYGNLQVVTSGNDGYKPTDPMYDLNIGFIRTKPVGESKDYINYANQIRKATPEEIAKANGKISPNSNASIGEFNKNTPVESGTNKKYKTTLNLQDKNDVEQLRRIFGDAVVEDMLKGKMENWRGTSYEDLGRVNIISKTPKTVAEELKGKIKKFKLDSNILYHGTSAENTTNILEKGFKKGSDLPEDAFRSGGYGQMQNSISFSTDPKIASNFTGNVSRGVIFKTSIKPDANIVKIDGITHAEDLNDFIPELLKQKIDAVYIPDEKEVVVINKKVLNKIEDYKEFDVINRKEDLKTFFGGTKKINGPTGNASVGTFTDGTPVELGSIDTIRPIEMPELVRLAREISGSFPNVKKKVSRMMEGGARGIFKEKGDGQIDLRADIFADPVQATKTLAHEIGHLIDWLPDKTLKRGNILGRIYTLRKFMAGTFDKVSGQKINIEDIRKQAREEILNAKGISYGEYVTSQKLRTELKPFIKDRFDNLMENYKTIENKVVKKELQTVTEYWRPYDTQNSSESYKKYRNSSKELYADAISMLFNSPGTLERLAPTFYHEFFAALDQKMDVKAEYFELQALLNGDSEKIFQARKEDIRKGFARAEDLQKEFADKKKNAVTHYWERLRQQLDDINYPILKKQYEAESKGVVIPESENPKFLLQENSMVDNENFLLVDQIDRDIVKPIENAGMIIDDLGEYLMLHRIQNDRKDIANPFGFNQENAGKQLEFMKSQVGEENFKLLQEKAQQFHDLVFQSVEEAVRVGSYNKELFETTIKPNKDTYASFSVVDYLQDYVPAGVKAQVGTLKEIANPFVSTILKTIALNRLNALQRAKNGTIKLLKDNFADEIDPTKRITTDGKLSIFKPAKDKGNIQVLEDGKLQSYDVDPYIADAFDKSKVGDLNVLVSILDKFNSKLFKPVVTTYNLGFALGFNPMRDFKRNYKLIKDATILDVVKAYAQSFPSAFKYAKGELDEFTRSLVESKAMNAPMVDYNFDPRDDELGRILERYGLIKKDEPYTNKVAELVRKAILKPTAQVLESIRFMADMFENVSKISGARVRMKYGESGKELAYNMRNFTGTPNFRVRGQQTNTSNAIFVFSNIMKEGIKSDISFATDPKTRSGYWFKTAKVDFLPKFLMFLASAGVLGAEVKKHMDDATEYDKSNYIIVPLGTTENNKSLYLRIPHDETGRFFSVIFWKMLNAIKDGGNTKDLQDIFALGAGQLPSVSPLLTIGSGWTQYLSGRNPYDSFRGRTVIDDTTFTAGGPDALKKMIQWTTNSLGFTKFATYDTSKQTTVESFLQVAPFFSSLFKVTNYGQQEKLNAVQQTAKQLDAQRVLNDREIVQKYVDLARKEGGTSVFVASKYKNQIIKDGLGGHLPKDEDEANYASNLMTKFKRALKRGLNDDPRVDEIITAGTNAQKKVIIKSIKDSMSAEDYNKFKTSLLEDKIVTPEVLYSVK